jgi:hypothetical protein
MKRQSIGLLLLGASFTFVSAQDDSSTNRKVEALLNYRVESIQPEVDKKITVSLERNRFDKAKLTRSLKTLLQVTVAGGITYLAFMALPTTLRTFVLGAVVGIGVGVLCTAAFGALSIYIIYLILSQWK